MSSTHLSLHYHLIFGTKNHEPMIAPDWRPQLHAFMGGVLRTLGGTPHMIGGVSDHVHVLFGLQATHCLADVVCELKAVSSKWVHDAIKWKGFAWQEGYGAFTVSASQQARMRAYIANQEDHHRHRTFREEYLAFLRYSGVAFDEQYV